MTIACIFDTETTGLVNSGLLGLDRQPEIIEFYAILIDLNTGEEKASFGSFTKPSRPVSSEITKITGITNETLAEAGPWSHIHSRVSQLIAESDVIVAHNLSFDMEMLELERLRLKDPPWPWPQRLFCTVEQTIHLKGFRLSLGALHEELFGAGFKDSHRAETDVRALARCFMKMNDMGMV